MLITTSNHVVNLLFSFYDIQINEFLSSSSSPFDSLNLAFSRSTLCMCIDCILYWEKRKRGKKMKSHLMKIWILSIGSNLDILKIYVRMQQHRTENKRRVRWTWNVNSFMLQTWMGGSQFHFFFFFFFPRGPLISFLK